MTNAQLYFQLSSLSEDLKEQVANYVAFLHQKANNDRKPKQRMFGCAKGLIKIAPDFDKPLSEFDDYC